MLCLHGLTRNSRDFAALAGHIAPARRVIVPDQRGRGRSQYDANWLNYHPGTYVDDMWTLLRELSVERVIVVGTSLGGLMAMLMAAMRPQMLAGVVLNDIGPEIDPSGVARIQSYAGRLPPVRNWDDAAAQMKMTFGAAMPDYDERQWHAFARQSFDAGDDGVPRLAADSKIGDAIRSIPAPPGAAQAMWLAFGQLRNIPSLAIRGAHSDLLSAATFERMQSEVPGLRRGHRVESRPCAATRRAAKPARDRRFPRGGARVAGHGIQGSFLRPRECVRALSPGIPAGAVRVSRHADAAPRSRAGLRDRQRPGGCRTGAAFRSRDCDRRQRPAAAQRGVDPHVTYVGNLAEQPALQDRSVDLAVAAQAAHWFDHERFHPEMRRVLRPDGALALWTYGLASISPPIDAVVSHYYENVVGPYWPPERRHVENAYRDLPFPWHEVAAPAIPAPSGMDAGRLRRLHRHLVRHAAVYQGVRRRPAAGLT